MGHLAVQIAKARGAEVYATVSRQKARIVESYGATPIDYTTASVEDYTSPHTRGEGFDITYDTLGGPSLDASFRAVKRYTGHVVSCLGWGTHSLAPLSFRAAAYSGVFTLLLLLTGQRRSHHGEILNSATEFANAGKLKPIVTPDRFTPSQLGAAYSAVAAGSAGKVVVDITLS